MESGNPTIRKADLIDEAAPSAPRREDARVRRALHGLARATRVRADVLEYVAAAVLAALGLLFQWVIDRPAGAHTAFQCTLLAVLLSGWLLGLSATLVCIFFAAVGQAYLFLEPRGALVIGSLHDAVQFTLFVLISLVIAYLTDRLKRSRSANDVTLRQLIQSNRARQVSEHRLDAGLNSMIDPILMLLPVRGADGAVVDFVIEYLNEPAACLHAALSLGRDDCSRGEQLGRRLAEVAPIHGTLGLFQAYAQVLETGTPLDRQVIVPSAATPGGSPGGSAQPREAEVRASRMGDGLVVHWRDMSEHHRAQRETKLSEERYRSLVQAIGAIVWGTSASGEFEPPQLEWAVFSGQRPEQYKGWGWLDAIHPEDRMRTAQTWADSLRRRVPYEVEHRLRRADGEYRDMLVRAVPILDAGGAMREWVGVHTDVTERRRAEQIIADSERQLRRVLNALYAFVGVLLPDGTLVGANEAPLKAAGIGVDDVMGQKLWDCYWFSYAEAMQTQLRGWVDQARAGETIRQDIQIRVAGGAMVFIDFMLSPMRDEHGQVTHLIPSGVDVSDRKRAQAELADRERHYRQLIEGLPMLTWTSTAEGEFDYLNERWSQYTGRATAAQLSFGWLESVHPDDRGRLERTWRHAVAGGERLAIEFRLRRYDGEHRWFDTRAEPIRDAEGRVIRWFGTSLDIHDRRRAEQRFRRLYESNLAGVVFYHYDGTLTDPNDAFYTLLGYDPKHPPKSISWWGLTPPEWAEVDAAQRRMLDEQGRCGPFEKELIRADGSRVPVMIAGADLDPGNHEYGVAYVMDMTHVKGVEEALRRTEANLRMVNESLEHRIQERTLELQQRSEQLRALALDITETESRERKRLAQLLHDGFQQLVSAAKLKVGIVRRRLSDPALIETVKQVEGLLEETINASRSLATELSPPVLHDAGLAAACDWLARRMEKDHNLIVTVDFDPTCEPDNEQVQTILFECARELLFNVTKHSGSTSAELGVSMPQEGLLQLTVTDHGKGFDAHSMDAQAKPDGSFGLFSIKERLGLLGGLVRVRSEPGVGTTVTMTVPVTVKSQRRRGIGGPLPEMPVGDFTAGVPNVRVLVADDHRLFREGLISLIGQESFVEIVGQANDGEEAVALARQLRPDILIVDVTMPKLNGVQVTTILSKELPETKVIGLSMHERDDMANAMRDAGAVAYCTKGGPTDTLLNVLRSVASTDKSTTA